MTGGILVKRPIIGITSITAFDDKFHSQRVTYTEAVRMAGGDAILLPSNLDKSNCAQIVSMLDGLIAPGGPDVDPDLYGEQVLPECGSFCRYEDEYDMELVKEAVKQGKPVLAICRGMQVINVLYGGTLYQDLASQYGTEIQHPRMVKDVEIYHKAIVEENSFLSRMMGVSGEVAVNSSHHQAVKDLASGFKIVAKAPDGTVEAIENEDGSIVCVQWHPERMQDMEMYRKLFRDFAEKCR